MKYLLSSENQYFNEVKNSQNLQSAQINNLVLKAQEGDKIALDKIVLSYQRMITKITMKYTKNNKLDFMDLVQEGNMGLLTAINTFNHLKNTKFITYSYYLVCRSISKAIQSQSSLIKLPQYSLKKKNYIAYPIITKSLNELDHKMNVEEIEKYAEDSFDNSNNYLFSNEEKTLVENYLRSIKPRIREIIYLYFGLNGYGRHTYAEIGKVYKVSKSAIWQIIHKQIRILRTKIFKF